MAVNYISIGTVASHPAGQSRPGIGCGNVTRLDVLLEVSKGSERFVALPSVSFHPDQGDADGVVRHRQLAAQALDFRRSHPAPKLHDQSNDADDGGAAGKKQNSAHARPHRISKSAKAPATATPHKVVQAKARASCFAIGPANNSATGANAPIAPAPAATHSSILPSTSFTFVDD
jgi:hypothetical protein